MVNQKGQAFSVFELMIAGVVAFAILMVLMQVIGGVLTGQDTDALDAISSTVKSAYPSMQKTTGNFVLKRGDSVDVIDLAMSTDLDEEYFVFGRGTVGDESGLEIGVDHITYTDGSRQKIYLSAVVICKPTGQAVSDAIYRLGDGDASCNDSDRQCCAIIINKREN